MTDPATDPATEQTPTGKGRPTPKRPQQARGPVAPPPKDRKSAAKRLRASQADGRKSLRESYAKGDDAVLLPRDQGPYRRFARDYVDSRRNLSTLLLPVAVVVIAVGFTGNVEAQQVTFGMWLATLLAAVLDSLLVTFLLRSLMRKTFPDVGRTRGHVFYALMRATQLRRLRKPAPQKRPPSALGRRSS